ncbi:[protein-PII] uridylyltransferase [Pseudonocardiaceae bacterium YIM PH 21723]|nr:[protein-PII] uridylyltransferase [Pseudonocardiaceae bacterium YIM PH 21723]
MTVGKGPEVVDFKTSGSAGDLLRARAMLLKPAPGQRKLSAEVLRSALVDLHDFWLGAHAARCGIAAGSNTALIAVGALGRRELVPHSDLDLVLVHGGVKAEQITEQAESLWYPLWDAGIGLDHAVRTPDQAVSVAKDDLRAALGLLEARHLAGDPELSQKLISLTRQAWRAGIRNRLPELVEAAQQRWSRSGELTHRVEPDVKNGRGGLRDIQLLDALAAAQIIERPGPEVNAARTLLLDVRTELHRGTGRAREVVRAQEGDEIAAALRIGDRFDLARAMSGAGRTVSYALDVAVRAAKAAMPKRGLSALRRAPVRRPLDDGVVEHGGEVALARDAQPTRDPALLLRVAASAARLGMPIAAGTLNKLADSAPELRGPWPREALSELLALLGSGRGLTDVVEALDRSGLWGRLFPEWGHVRDLPPRDAAHIWTVDRHLVQVVAESARLLTRVSRPDLLLLTALLHDLGKGREAADGMDHSEAGAELAQQIGTRLGLWPSDVKLLVAAVRHHLLLPHTATRRDVEDPATVHRVVETLDGDWVLLELLHALVEADSLATGPGVWSGWKSTLIDDLVGRTRAAMAGDDLPAPVPLAVELQALAAKGKTEVLVDEVDHATVVTVIAPDRPGLLSKAAGVLALNSLEVHAAELNEHAGMAVDVFTVSPRFGSAPEPTLLREQFLRSMDGSLPLTDRLAAKERDYGGPPVDPPPPRVLWFDDEATGAVVLELRAADRIGLLHRVAAALEGCGVDVRWARVATIGVSVVDSFCLAIGDPVDAGTAVLTVVERRRIEHAILAAAT